MPPRRKGCNLFRLVFFLDVLRSLFCPEYQFTSGDQESPLVVSAREMSMEKEKNMKEVMVEGHPVPLADLHQLFKQLTEVNLTKEELHTVLEEIISTSKLKYKLIWIVVELFLLLFEGCPGLPTLVSEKLSIGIAESCFEVNTGYYDYGSGHIIMKLLQIISSFRVFAAILLVHIKAIDPISEDIKEISKNVPRYSQAECSIEKYHFLNSVHKQGFEIM